ncbi:MAG: hypothetical protein AAGK22_04550 [Acidobacteriota bacterium]
MKARHHQLAVLLCATALLAAFSGSALASDSPQEVFRAAVDALENENYAGLVEAVAPSERTMMAFSLTIAVEMGVGFWEGAEAEAAQKSFAELKTKHGLDDSDDSGPEISIGSDTSQEEIDAHMEQRAAALFEDVDVPTYVAELVSFFLQTPMMEGESLLPDVELTDVQIDGDRATAKAGDADLEFLREAGRWYMASP